VAATLPPKGTATASNYRATRTADHLPRAPQECCAPSSPLQWPAVPRLCENALFELIRGL
jgi:hypothetical protein